MVIILYITWSFFYVETNGKNIVGFAEFLQIPVVRGSLCILWPIQGASIGKISAKRCHFLNESFYVLVECYLFGLLYKNGSRTISGLLSIVANKYLQYLFSLY